MTQQPFFSQRHSSKPHHQQLATIYKQQRRQVAAVQLRTTAAAIGRSYNAGGSKKIFSPPVGTRGRQPLHTQASETCPTQEGVLTYATKLQSHFGGGGGFNLSTSHQHQHQAVDARSLPRVHAAFRGINTVNPLKVSVPTTAGEVPATQKNRFRQPKFFQNEYSGLDQSLATSLLNSFQTDSLRGGQSRVKNALESLLAQRFAEQELAQKNQQTQRSHLQPLEHKVLSFSKAKPPMPQELTPSKQAYSQFPSTQLDGTRDNNATETSQWPPVPDFTVNTASTQQRGNRNCTQMIQEARPMVDVQNTDKQNFYAQTVLHQVPHTQQKPSKHWHQHDREGCEYYDQTCQPIRANLTREAEQLKVHNKSAVTKDKDGTERLTVDINPVLLSLGTKSSRPQVSKKTSNRLLTHSSFLSIHSNSNNNIKVKRLASFNDDLREVCNLAEFKDLMFQTPKQKAPRAKETSNLNNFHGFSALVIDEDIEESPVSPPRQFLKMHTELINQEDSADDDGSAARRAAKQISDRMNQTMGPGQTYGPLLQVQDESIPPAQEFQIQLQKSQDRWPIETSESPSRLKTMNPSMHQDMGVETDVQRNFTPQQQTSRMRSQRSVHKEPKVSSMTLTMSQKEIEQFSFTHNKDTVSDEAGEQSVEAVKFEPSSPLIIQSNPLSQRQPPSEPTVKQQAPKPAKNLTIEQVALKQIAELDDNNSIIIDCNALVSSPDPDKRRPRLKDPVKQPVLNSGALTGTDYGSKLNSPKSGQLRLSTSQKGFPPSPEKQQAAAVGAIRRKQGKQKTYLLGNPLMTSQLLRPQAKVNKLGTLETEEDLRKNGGEWKRDDQANLDITDVKMSNQESGIGVGSVVLHLRKNKNGKEGNPSVSNEKSRTLILNQSEEIDINESQPAVSTTTPPSRCQNLPERKNFKSLQPPERATTRGKVLQQKPLKNLVRTAGAHQGTQMGNKASVTPRGVLRQMRQGPDARRGSQLTSADMAGLELVGTQKQKQVQLPRLPKKIKKKQSSGKRVVSMGLQNNSQQTTFVIPYSNQIHLANMLQSNSSSNEFLGDTLSQTANLTHQMILLQSGQMMLSPLQFANPNFIPQHPSQFMALAEDPGTAARTSPIRMTLADKQGTATAEISQFELNRRESPHSNSKHVSLGLPSPVNQLELPKLQFQLTQTPESVADGSAVQQKIIVKQIKLQQSPRFPEKGAKRQASASRVFLDSVCATEKADEDNTSLNRVEEPMDARSGNEVVTELDDLPRFKAATANIKQVSIDVKQKKNLHETIEQIQWAQRAHAVMHQEEPVASPFVMLSQAALRQQQAQRASKDGKIVAPEVHRITKVIRQQNQIRISTDKRRLGEFTNGPLPLTRISSSRQHQQKLSPGLSLLRNELPIQRGSNVEIESPTAQVYLINASQSNQAVRRGTQTSGFVSLGMLKSAHSSEDTLAQNLKGSKLEHTQKQLQQQQLALEQDLQQRRNESQPSSNSYQKIILEAEDPIIRKKQQHRSPRTSTNFKEGIQTKGAKKEQFELGAFKPWEDKPDNCLNQSGTRRRGNSKRLHRKISLEGSPVRSSNGVRSSIAARKSLESRLSQTNPVSARQSAQKLISQQFQLKSPAATVNSSIERSSNKISRFSKVIVVEEKVQKSKRRKQEEQMKEIVFEDLNTPHFRKRYDGNEDNPLLAEISKEALSNTSANQVVETPEPRRNEQIDSPFSAEEQSRNHAHQFEERHSKTTDYSLVLLDDNTAGMQPMMEPEEDERAPEDSIDKKLRSRALEAVLAQTGSQMALTKEDMKRAQELGELEEAARRVSASRKSHKKSQKSKLRSSRIDEKSSVDKSIETSKVQSAEPVVPQASELPPPMIMDDKIALIALRQRNRRRMQVDEGECLITDANIDSYFQK